MKTRTNERTRGLLYGLLFVAAAATVAHGNTTYTLDNHFDQGVLLNLNHSSPNNNQLQLNVTGAGFPVLWIANAGEHTVSKFDTRQRGSSPGREVSRYYTWFSNQGASSGAWSGPAPSRTAMDIDGNAYVLNRHFDGRPPLLFKILANGFVDRNGNGVIDTSSDTNNDGVIQGSEMKPLLDSNGNGMIDPAEIQDERIAWAVRVPDGIAAPLRAGALGRSLCIGTDGNLWVGLYNDYSYYKVSGQTGATIAGPVPVPNVSPYGCLIDRNGTLWSAGLGSYLGKIGNTQSNTGPYPATSYYHGNYGGNYGIALGTGPANQTLVYLGGTGYSYLRFDSATSTFSTPADYFQSAIGVNTDGAGNILVSKSSGGVTVFEPVNGAVVWDKPPQGGTSSDSRGIMPDAEGNVWQVHLGASRISKFRGSDGTALGTLPTGNSPYTYSDASGFAAANITVQTGTWTVIQDGGGAGTRWGKVSWNATVPPGGAVTAKVRASDTQTGLQGQNFTDVVNGSAFNLAGRYIEAQVRLTANSQGVSPVVADVTIGSSLVVCDADRDGDVDRNDISLITAVMGRRVAAGDPRDFNSDGLVTINDSRGCVLRCTRPNCVVQ